MGLLALIKGKELMIILLVLSLPFIWKGIILPAFKKYGNEL